MSVLNVNRNPTTKDLHRFALAMVFGFGVIGAVVWFSAWWRTGDRAMLGWSALPNQITALGLWLLGIGLGLAGYGPHRLARTVYIGWMTFGTKLGVVASTVLLTVLFVILLPPFSVIVRLGDPLRKKLVVGGTYWEDHKRHEPTLERIQRPF